MSSTAATGARIDLMLLLSQVSHALETELTAGLAHLEIVPRTHCVLAAAMPGDRTQSQLAEQCDLDKTTMVVTIDALEAAGLATRRPSPTDRRVRIIAVTEAGRQLVAEAQKIVDAITEDVLGTLPVRERTAFVAALDRLSDGRLADVAECDHPPRRRAVRPVHGAA